MFPAVRHTFLKYLFVMIDVLCFMMGKKVRCQMHPVLWAPSEIPSGLSQYTQLVRLFSGLSGSQRERQDGEVLFCKGKPINFDTSQK